MNNLMPVARPPLVKYRDEMAKEVDNRKIAADMASSRMGSMRRMELKDAEGRLQTIQKLIDSGAASEYDYARSTTVIINFENGTVGHICDVSANFYIWAFTDEDEYEVEGRSVTMFGALSRLIELGQ